MKVTDPRPFLDGIDQVRLQTILGYRQKMASDKPTYVEPSGTPASKGPSSASTQTSTGIPSPQPPEETSVTSDSTFSSDNLRGKVQRLGDFIDTDAVSPLPIFPFHHQALTS